MTDATPQHPHADELTSAGVPPQAWAALGGHGMGTLVPKLGIRFEEFAVDRVVATMPVEGNTQVVGLLHGGASAALAETLGSLAAALHASEGRVPVGVDLNITHHRGLREGTVRGICTPLHLGRTTTSHQIVLEDESGTRLATARITNQLLLPRG